MADVFASNKLLLAQVIGEAGRLFDFEVVVVFRTLTATHAAFRERCGERPDRRHGNRPIVTGWPISARSFLDFVSKAVFNHTPYMNSFQQVAKTQGAASHALARGPF